MSNRHDSQFNRAIIDAIPFPLFVVDDDVKIVAFNHAGSSMLGDEPALAFNTKGGRGPSLHPLDGGDWRMRSIGGMQDLRRSRLGGSVLPGQGRGPPSTKDAAGRSPRGARYLPPHNDQPFPSIDRTLAVLMFQDIGELVSTQGMVPICMHCRKVRDTSDGWAPMEQYLKDHLDLDLSHGVCLDCLKKYYPEVSGQASD